MAVIASPSIHRVAGHHEISTNDVTSHPIDSTGASAGTTILDEQKAKNDRQNQQEKEQQSSGVERPPGLWLFTGLGIYLLYRLFA